MKNPPEASNRTFETQTHAVLQSAALRMSLVVMPIDEAFDEDAPLSEWAPKREVSQSKHILNHRAMVLEKTA